jgi:serine/threonine protein kinase
MVKKVGQYQLGRTLGEGTFGKVKYAEHVVTNGAVAIKVLEKEKIQKQNMGEQIRKEISIMKKIKHRYVVEMIEVLASKSKIFIVLELVQGGELFNKIVDMGKMPEDQALFYFRQLVTGIAYCHRAGVCHRDLKPENLLLDENGNLKISDFGLSSLYVGDSADNGTTRTQILHTTCGTPNYVAPEVLADQGYDGKKADVWSIGVILYVLLAGFLPFDEKTIVQLFSKIQKAEFEYPKWFSSGARSLLNRMIEADPKKRITLMEVKSNEWILEKLPGWVNEPEEEVVAVEGEAAGGAIGNEEVSGSGKESATENSKIPAPIDTTAGSATSAMKDTSKVSPKGAEDIAASIQKPASFYPISRGADGTATDFGDALDASIDESVTTGGSRPRILNAFDLINQCGGFALDKFFAPEFDVGSSERGTLVKRLSSKKMSINDAAMAPPKSDGDDMNASDKRLLSRVASVRIGGASDRRTGGFHFSSNVVPAKTLMCDIYTALKQMNFEFVESIDVAATTGKLRASLMTPARGSLGLTIFVYTLCSSLSLVEINRGKGDLLEWNNVVLGDLVNNKIAHLINRPSGAGEAKADVSPRAP